MDLPIGTLVSTLTSTTVAAWANFSNTGAGWERIFDFGTGTTRLHVPDTSSGHDRSDDLWDHDPDSG